MNLHLVFLFFGVIFAKLVGVQGKVSIPTGNQTGTNVDSEPEVKSAAISERTAEVNHSADRDHDVHLPSQPPDPPVPVVDDSFDAVDSSDGFMEDAKVQQPVAKPKKKAILVPRRLSASTRPNVTALLVGPRKVYHGDKPSEPASAEAPVWEGSGQDPPPASLVKPSSPALKDVQKKPARGKLKDEDTTDLRERFPEVFQWEEEYQPTTPPTTIPPTTTPSPGSFPVCGDNCPKYDVIEERRHYEVRQYKQATWISTVLMTDSRLLAEMEGYFRLRDYFKGINDKGTLINLTTPLLTQMRLGKHPGVLKEMNDFTVSLYLPESFGADPPSPLSNEMLLDTVDQSVVFVDAFEAWLWEVGDRFLRGRVDKLAETLRANGEAFMDRYYYLAAYNRPEAHKPIRYEVWLFGTRFRDPEKIKPRPQVRHPPMTKMTSRTRKRLCRGVECPPFDVLRIYRNGIQKRLYYDGVFASTAVDDCSFSNAAVWKGFMPLHLYKHGVNSHLEVLEATRPIGIIHVNEAKADNRNGTCRQNMTVLLYLPERLHSNPPTTGPLAPAIQIVSINDLIVYVHTLGGYLMEPARVEKEVADFTRRLNQFGACFKSNEYFVVIYDYIVRFYGRQNEIWIVAENCDNRS